jgi:hypothetical protein
VRDATLDAALDALVPAPSRAVGDWEDALRRAGISSTRPRLTRRHALVAALLAIAVVVLFATPAFGLLRDWIGRKDVTFGSEKSAPTEVKRGFYDLAIGAPPDMALQPIAGQARRVGVFHGRALYVAPTRQGGFCWFYAHSVGSCRTSHSPPKSTPAFPGDRNPLLLGIASMERDTGSVSLLAGEVIARGTQRLEIEYADGSVQGIPFVWVSKPIDAGFFYVPLPAGHARLRAFAALDGTGKVLARRTFPSRAARLHVRRPPPRPLPAVPATPAPTPPFQRGADGGVTVVVGANGVAEFDVAHAADPTLMRRAAWGCFKFTVYHQEDPAGLGYEAQARHSDRIAMNGLAPPYDGCEVRATYGHTWPDRNGSHSAAEIAFTARGRRYFADRAAARDLALFVRTREHHSLRATAAIGVQRAGGATTYSERSSTGRRFFVTLDHDKVIAENVRTFAYVR